MNWYKLSYEKPSLYVNTNQWSMSTQHDNAVHKCTNLCTFNIYYLQFGLTFIVCSPRPFFSFNMEISDNEKINKSYHMQGNFNTWEWRIHQRWLLYQSEQLQLLFASLKGCHRSQNQMVWVLVFRENKRIRLRRERMREIIYESAKLSYLYYFVILLLIAV